MEKVQNRVATEVPVGKCGYVGEYVEGKSTRTPYWMDQALESMEEKNFPFEGGGSTGRSGARRRDIS